MLCNTKKCERVVEEDAWLLAYVPDKFKTQKICEKAAEKSPWTMQNVPDSYTTQEICERNLYVLENTHDKYISERIGEKEPETFEFISDQGKTQEICEGWEGVCTYTRASFSMVGLVYVSGYKKGDKKVVDWRVMIFFNIYAIVCILLRPKKTMKFQTTDIL